MSDIPTRKRTALLIGITGSGKSSLSNLLKHGPEWREGQATFKISGSAASETKEFKKAEALFNGWQFEIIDTMGLCDTNDNQQIVRSKIVEAVKQAARGVDVILFVIKKGRFTEQEFASFEYVVHAILGAESLPYTHVVVTHCEKHMLLHEEARNNWIKESLGNEMFSKTLYLVSHKVHFVCNPPDSKFDSEVDWQTKIKERLSSYEALTDMLAKLDTDTPYKPRLMEKVVADYDRKEKERELAIAALEERGKAEVEARQSLQKQIADLLIQGEKEKKDLNAKVSSFVDQRVQEAKEQGFFTSVGKLLDGHVSQITKFFVKFW